MRVHTLPYLLKSFRFLTLANFCLLLFLLSNFSACEKKTVTVPPKKVRTLAELASDLKDSNPKTRLQAAKELQNHGKEIKALLPNLEKSLTTDETQVRLYIISSLQRIPREAESLTPVIVEQLKERDDRLRLAAVRLLLEFHNDEARDQALRSLGELLGSSNPAIRKTACAEFAVIDNLPARLETTLRRSQADLDPDIRTCAKLALLKLTGNINDPDLKVLFDNPLELPQVTGALLVHKTPTITQFLIDNLENELLIDLKPQIYNNLLSRELNKTQCEKILTSDDQEELEKITPYRMLKLKCQAIKPAAPAIDQGKNKKPVPSKAGKK